MTFLPTLSVQKFLERERFASFDLPALVFTPFKKAVPVPAESGTCWSTLYVLDRADHGNFSQLRTYSSPDWFNIWPARIRAAVVVVIPIPSPRNKIVFFAVWVSGCLLRLSLMSFTPSLNHWFSVCLVGREIGTPAEGQEQLKLLSLIRFTYLAYDFWKFNN